MNVLFFCGEGAVNFVNVRGWPRGLWGGQGLREERGAGGWWWWWPGSVWKALDASLSAQRGRAAPLHGQCLCESPSKQMKFHTTQISEFKRGGRWVEKRERRRGREKMQAGRAPAPHANATGKVASFPGVPSGPRAPCSLSLCLRLLEAVCSV